MAGLVATVGVIAEGADDRTSGPVPQGLHPVPGHHQAVAGFHRSQPPADPDDEQVDFAKLVAPLENCYCPDFGRPAIHPEVMVRALRIRSRYNIASLRRLCSAISENIAYRWFCFLTIDDPVFDHSSISHFIDRVGRGGFAAVFDGLNDELLRLRLLSPEMYVDSSLVKANVSGYGSEPSGMTVAEFKEHAIEENGLFVSMEITVDGDYGGSVDRRQLVLPVATTIFAGRDGVIIRYGGTVDYRPTSQAIEAETYGRQDTGNGSGQGWDERAFSAQVAEWAIAVAGETGASVAHSAGSLRRGVGG